MAQVDCIAPFKTAMKIRRDMIALAAEALCKMFERGEDELVQQALQAELVPFLLRLLEGGLQALENPAATKAQLVKALKAMQRSLQFGEQVRKIFNNRRELSSTSFIESSAVSCNGRKITCCCFR